MNDATSKVCKRCQRQLPKSEFYPDRRAADRLRYNCKSCQREMRREEFATDAGRLARRAAQRRFMRSEKWKSPENSSKRARHRKNYIKRNIAKVLARQAVSNATATKILPRAKTLKCVHCKARMARFYHHYKGYEEKHWLDVVPLCFECHQNADGIYMIPNQEELMRELVNG